jgi:hypothetical protein
VIECICMNEQEQKDLELLRVSIADAKMMCFEYLKYLNTATREHLDMSGYRGKSNAEAMQEHFQHRLKEIDKLTKVHLRKYPD